MLAKTALLIVSNPKQIRKILPSIQKQVKSRLYIHLQSALTDPFGNFCSSIFNSWPKYSQTICGIYSQAAIHCKDLDVRVLLSGLKYQDYAKIQTKSPVDLVIFDQKYDESATSAFINTKIANVSKYCTTLTLSSGVVETFDDCPENGNVCEHAVLGGTFDRLHLAHKLMLSEAALRAKSKVTVGVTDQSMLTDKILFELIEEVGVRRHSVQDFLADICPELTHDVVTISDPYGPAIIDPTMNAIVVSEETVKGAQKINEIRESKKLTKLEIVPIQLIQEPEPYYNNETKISSSTLRMRQLGSLLRPPTVTHEKGKPFIVGLTGGIGSGKSSICKILQQLGAVIINCDAIGHSVYKAGTDCNQKLVDYFGEAVRTQEGEIDRKALGAIVFKNREQLAKLNEIVWPAIAAEVESQISQHQNDFVVIEAAVLLTAGWDTLCNEIWVTLVPKDEAVMRLHRDRNLTKEEAKVRVEAQPPNSFYVERANVVLCTFWAEQFTKEQVEKAFREAQGRIH